MTILILLAASSGLATTWHVAKDGSGDFMVIQDAVDAASAGDTIWIHAGRYEEVTEDWDVWGDGSSLVDCHVVVTKDDLSLVGDGKDATIIGAIAFPDDPDAGLTGINVTYNEASALTVRDLSIENVNYGMYLRSPTCEVTGCRFEGVRNNCLLVYTASTCFIDRCEFNDSGIGILSFDPTSNLVISNSDFVDVGGVSMSVSTDSVEIENCTAVNAQTGIGVQQGSIAIIRSTDISVSSPSGTGISLEMGGRAELYDSRLFGGWCGVYSNGESIICERTVFDGQTTWITRINNTGNSVFHDCEFNPSGEYTVMCLYNGSGDCHIDMTNNYWGTDSEEQIAELIHDSNDDPGACCTVDFIPFHDQSTPTEQRSWSSVKDLFDSDGDR